MKTYLIKLSKNNLLFALYSEKYILIINVLPFTHT